MTFPNIQINSERLLANLAEQGRIGWQAGKGLSRAAYTADYLDARAFAQQKMQQAGLITRIDAVGNLFGLLEGSDPEAKIILSGSHLDAVAEGGIYDGQYGVFAALEAAQSIRENGIQLRHSLEVVGFTAEEGGPLGGTFGSRCFCGLVEQMPGQNILTGCGLSEADIQSSAANLNRYECFLEAHIEQGPVLERANLSAGIPTGIVGITRYRCTVRGEANHAGTTPMRERRDAFYASANIIKQWLDFMRAEPEMVGNVGEIEIEPGQISVVAGQCCFTVEIRALDPADTERAALKLGQLLESEQECQGEMVCIINKAPGKLDQGLIELVELSCIDLGISSRRMPSGASHDASPLSKVMPTAMIFVPSKLGISHSKDEYTAPNDLAHGAEILLQTILRVDAQ